MSVWLAEPKARKRGKAPSGLTRERIVREAVRVLDKEGLEAFSMRKLAGELGVTPMSVYWYVDNKSDLLELALDEVLGEIALPEAKEDPDRADGMWQQQLKALAREFRRILDKHPWTVTLFGSVFNLGPQSRRFSSAVLEVTKRSGLPVEQLPGAMSLLMHFVIGFTTIDVSWQQRVRESGLSEDELAALALRTAREADPQWVAMVDELQVEYEDGVRTIRERDFETALDGAVLGIDAMVRAARLVRETGVPERGTQRA